MPLEVWDRVENTNTQLRGTVRFYGAVEHSPDNGVYTGVEWDLPGSGKYDGEIFGKRYFSAGAKSSSFIKESKLVAGRDLCQVLRARYETAEEHAKDTVKIGAGKKKPAGVVNVHAPKSVYRDPQGAFSNVVNITASGLPVSKAGEIGVYFPSLRDLSLANTLISRWAEVFQILSGLPQLRVLSLSGNRFEPVDTADFDSGKVKVPALETLLLSDTTLPWGAVRFLLKALPTLTELHAADNGYADEPLPLSRDDAPSLRNLRLDRNQIRSWSTMEESFAGLQGLETLHLSGNPLEEVTCGQPFPSLSSLFLRKTAVGSWDSIDALRAHGIKELSLSDTPLTDGQTEHERRCLLIARLPSLEVLNRGQVGKDERISSERFMVRYYHGRDDAPVYLEELVAKHGELLPLADVDMSPKLTADVSVRYPEIDQTTSAVLNVRQTVGQLKRALCKPFCIPQDSVLLTRIDPEVAGSPLEEETLTTDERMLFTYGMKDGDVVVVSSRKEPLHRD